MVWDLAIVGCGYWGKNIVRCFSVDGGLNSRRLVKINGFSVWFVNCEKDAKGSYLGCLIKTIK